MRKLIAAFIILLSPFVYASEQQGGQFKDLGPWEVHYIAFPSTFVQPNIAKAYNLTRSGNKAIVNISVLADKPGKPAIKAKVTGSAKNLLGKVVPLNFKEVVEGEAVYYLAQLDYDDEDIFRFNVEITKDKQTRKLTFSQKFYEE
ncbi:DUF4426 domain-containing protein [Pseudoalteromonas sp. McH1-7]|uniref:DUF4426 domain-containing protein n=1 Tax=Pseudoalteromonas peptidolytica F12-50-A1 TaxID=1315280 RepID=A0A8I0MY48_9GAMM|nr:MULTISPECIES: DUF4426 domain-containing protein [Pseudoalteromonas]MBE0347458.1 hypothetical protein [Pseudoalteromonas peptidolytica F12-50-A1]NLR13218.1 DUF4426 domain-containing protein [Pseudoalteromonas peptidolytica]NUZ12487.1 DUF4426 domain-containing protein [Pseudoalteromonas sp. McH1-7]RXF03504.1 DUF4426 domain-containing protein [Pseudoalteromonas sp. PS5]USD29194.1 DUF4426 domain-containing protein [Pseudoalteromonas sp. SCSIO 43201]